MMPATRTGSPAWSWRSSRDRRSTASDAGLALVAVLVVSMLAGMLAISLLYRVRAEHAAADAGRGGEQAWLAAMSGVHAAAEVVFRHGSRPEAWTDNPAVFRNRLVHDDGLDRWYFTVFAPADVDSAGVSSGVSSGVTGGVRYGVVDESSRFNVNAVDAELLARMPGMTPALADAVIDYIDHDHDRRREGAEQEDYRAAGAPYRIRNGRLASLDELLLVRGLDARALYGEDANLNHVLDRFENDELDSFPPDNADGVLDGGLRGRLTVWGIGWSVDHEQRLQVDLNRDIERLAEVDLSQRALEYIAAVRRQARRDAERHRDAEGGDDRRQTHEPPAVFGHPVDLLLARREIDDEDGRKVWIESGVGPDRIGELLEKTRTHPWHRFIARTVNVNTASADMLALVPGIDRALAASIVARRRDLDEARRRTTAWLLEEGLVDVERFRRLAPWLVARGYQFRVQVVGFGVPSGRFRVVEAVIDTGRDRPRITYLRDITRVGLPFPLRGDAERHDGS